MAESPPVGESVKHFVLDTNVLLHNPDALFVFEENHVVIPFPVIEELDKMKRREDDVGRSAREVIRHLDRLREVGRLTEGVKWGDLPAMPGTAWSIGQRNGQVGTVRIDADEHERPELLRDPKADNLIIAVALSLHKAGKRAVFVSKDLSARIKSDALGIQTEDFENQKVDADRLYTGYIELEVPGDLIDRMYDERLLPIEELKSFLTVESNGSSHVREVLANQFLLLRDDSDEHHTGIARRMADTDQVVPVTGPRRPVSGILARNLQQTMALDLLLDDQVKLITLLGPAGTGKTLLALAAAMAKVMQEERYEKLLAARPIMPLGRDIGFLPGDKDEKLTAWMQPIFDNLTYLFSTKGAPGQGTADSHTSEQRIQRLMADGKLVLEPLTYIRGRSIPHQFMVVDEAQNLTPHEVKTIASRVGEGTKLVLTGDIQQIDNPYLDASSNGLSYTVEKLKGEPLFGHVMLARSERSDLASLAAAKL